MSNTVDFRQAQIVFEYAKGPNLRSVHADGFLGGLTSSGYLHVAFFTEQPVLPTKHVFRLNPDGSLGAEVADDRSPQDPIVREMQASVLITANTAEVLRNWLDQYINNLRARTAGLASLAALKPMPLPVVQNDPERNAIAWLNELRRTLATSPTSSPGSEVPPAGGTGVTH